MFSFRRYRIELLFFLLFAVIYFAVRISTIASLPIFTDEAIYIRWAQIAKQDANWRFISLTDGKQPMYVWLTIISLRFFQDPLLAARLVSVAAGFVSMIGLFFLGRELFKNRWIGLLCSFLYLIYPFALVYDRMALYDSLVGTFAVWSLYLSIVLVRRARLDTALLLGLVMGGGVLTKTNAFFNLAFLPFTLLLYNFNSKEKSSHFFRWGFLAAIAAVLSYLYYSILRLSPFFHIIDDKNALFVFPFKEWIMHPFLFFFGNISGQWDWMLLYVTIPVLLLITCSFLIKKTEIKEKLMLVLWFAIPFMYLAFFGKVIYPRFIFFMTLGLLPLASYSLYYIFVKTKDKILFAIFLLAGISFFLHTDYFVLFDFMHSPVPRSDTDQFINDWPSGQGIQEAVAFFKQQADRGKIFIGTQGTFGLLPYALEIYLVNNPNIQIKGFWPIDPVPPKDLLAMAKKMPTYIVFYQPCMICKFKGAAPMTWPVKLVQGTLKGNGNTEIYTNIYQVLP